MLVLAAAIALVASALWFRVSPRVHAPRSGDPRRGDRRRARRCAGAGRAHRAALVERSRGRPGGGGFCRRQAPRRGRSSGPGRSWELSWPRELARRVRPCRWGRARHLCGCPRHEEARTRDKGDRRPRRRGRPRLRIVAGASGGVGGACPGDRRGDRRAGIVRAMPPWRRRVVLLGVAAGGLAGVFTAVAAVAGSSVRESLDAGLDRRGTALELLREDPDAAATELALAADEFAEAEERLTSIWVSAARLVPITSQHVGRDRHRGVRRRGRRRRAGPRQSPSRPTTSGSTTIDLDSVAVFADSRCASRRFSSKVTNGFAGGSTVAAPPVDDRLSDLRSKVADAGIGRTAAQVASVAAPLLGADGPRRYCVLAQNPSEGRGSGGQPSNFAEIVADEGRLDLVRSGRIEELIEGGTPPPARRVEMSDEFSALYIGDDRAGLDWQNVTQSPDFREVPASAAQLYPQSGGDEVDGVLSLDPFAFAALLEVTGTGPARGRHAARREKRCGVPPPRPVRHVRGAALRPARPTRRGRRRSVGRTRRRRFLSATELLDSRPDGREQAPAVRTVRACGSGGDGCNGAQLLARRAGRRRGRRRAPERRAEQDRLVRRSGGALRRHVGRANGSDLRKPLTFCSATALPPRGNRLR